MLSTTHSVVSTITVGTVPNSIALVGSNLWVANYGFRLRQPNLMG